MEFLNLLTQWQDSLVELEVATYIPIWGCSVDTNSMYPHYANLKIPKSNIKTLMKDTHQNAIKYSTYLVLNKRKLENKQATITPP